MQAVQVQEIVAFMKYSKENTGSKVQKSPRNEPPKLKNFNTELFFSFLHSSGSWNSSADFRFELPYIDCY